MIAEPVTKSNVCRNGRVRHGTAMPTMKLARILYAENPLLFKNVEDARYFLRRIEGKTGDCGFETSVKTGFINEAPRPLNPYNLPASDEIEYLPYKITGHKRVAVFSDVHIPYHNITSLTAAFDYCKKENPDAILLNGDVLDCHRLSRFIKDPKKRNFKQELDIFKDFFSILKREFSCKIYYKIGNHDERYEHFLQEKASELVGIEEFEFINIIKARAEGIEVIGDKRVMHLNELSAIHGHEYIGGISAPVNTARGLFLRSKVSSFQGHTHQTSEHTEPTMNGKMITTWSVGCLCELHPAYMPLNKWNHGFMIIDLADNGVDYEVRNKRIYNGKVL